ncbi:MAG TPA: Npt1/Npt2 family nucleotide transporter [Vicinamibacteria bacterium]|nr:Npt1/Npt2 family nucleotide transporter [Vicinamibacteria bacterium]
MSRLVARLLNLQREDLGRGGLLFAYLFLVIAGYVVGKAARSALFLGKYAAVNLPYMTVAIALMVGVVVAAYVRIARRTSLRNLLVGSLASFALTALAFWYAAQYHRTAWLYPAFYIWVGIYGVLAPAQAWTLANHTLTTREAKRLFGLVGSGAISGFIFGGFLTRHLVGRFGTESVLLGMALLSAACIVPVVLIFRFRAPRRADLEVENTTGLDRRFLETLRLVGSSPYLRAIAAVICLSSIATTIASWQFDALAQAHFAMDKNAIGRFLGEFYFYAGMACLVVQLAMTSRVLRRFGIGPALFVVPAALLLGSTAVLVSGALWAAILLRGSDQVLRYSIDKSGVELLYLPVAPGIKLAAKSFIDTVVWRMGDGLAGVALLVVATWAGVSAPRVSWLNLVFIGAWIAAALVARREYVETLRDSIQRHRLDAEAVTAPVLDRSAAALLAGQLQGTDPQEILYALGLLEIEGRPASHPAVRGLVDHPSAEVRRKAIAILSEDGDTTVRGRVEARLGDPDLEVRTEALLYLSRHAHLDPLARIEELGDFADVSIRAAVVACLAHAGPARNLPAAALLLDKMVGESGPEGARVRIEAARLLARLGDVFPEPLQRLIEDPDPEVAMEAVRAVGQLRNRRFLFVLLDKVTEPALSAAVVEALARFGDSAVGTLRDHLNDPAVAVEARREITAVLAAIGTPEAARALKEALLDADTPLRYRAIQALNKIYKARPETGRDTQMIEAALAAEILGHYRSYQVLGTLRESLPGDDSVVRAPRAAMEQEVERIFRLLGLLYPRYDLHSAYFGLQSSDPVVHDNALEFLDNVLPPPLRSVLVPLLDGGVSVSERVRLADRLVGTRLESGAQAAALLLASDEPWLKSCGAYAVGMLGLRQLEGELDRCLEHADPLLRESARQAKLRLADLGTAAGI